MKWYKLRCKAKKERQEWWHALSDDDKTKYIDKRMVSKFKTRLNEALEETKSLNYDCNKCIHGFSDNCGFKGKLSGGCKDYYGIKPETSILL